MKVFINNSKLITLGTLTLLILLSQIDCGSNNNSSTPAVGTVTAAGIVGPSGNAYSVTLSPSTSNPTVGSVVTASITVTDSAAETLTINAGYYNSSGSQVQQCSQSNGGSTSITISCVLGPFSTSENEALYVDVFETGGAEELACDVTGAPGCTGTFEVTVGSGGSGTGTGVGTYYLCPLSPSTGCTNASLCQSTCMGQYTDASYCTTFAADAVATQQTCIAVTAMTGAYSCPINDSVGCASASQCESTCEGQLQSTPNCTTYAAYASASSVNCTNESGTTADVYLCPYIPSNGCADTSECESTCMGQYTTQATCTYYGPYAVPTVTPCTSAGALQF